MEIPSEVLNDDGFTLWLSEWQEIDSSISANEFTLENEASIQYPYIYPEDHSQDILNDEVTKNRYVFSPSEEMFIDYFACFGEADSCVNAYNLEGVNRLRRLLFCGTGCGYHHAIWISDSLFVVFGKTIDHFSGEPINCDDNSQPQTCDQRLTIDLYDLTNNTQSLYLSKPRRIADNLFTERNNLKFFSSLPEEEKDDWRFIFN